MSSTACIYCEGWTCRRCTTFVAATSSAGVTAAEAALAQEALRLRLELEALKKKHGATP